MFVCVRDCAKAVELPLTHPELYDDIGIKPPKGVILYGEPGTGKTLLAKAVANQTSATFLRVVGSELIQKYLGDGPKMVRELFRVVSQSCFHRLQCVFGRGLATNNHQTEMLNFLLRCAS